MTALEKAHKTASTYDGPFISLIVLSIIGLLASSMTFEACWTHNEIPAS